ncbi:Lipopolysaccharide-modifying protein [Niveomyces insectorum RCEF 264]|uniref:Lipopolysaccharide-modifying protein n=1 Tax=Niveomyces insectorum RCEF 264 TaxID=1081102 RepID=A0A167XTC0_9HYPO|nr:Lipopolysaccharide-modifying protein [Niveomyces insectorum RCEF 264]
MIPRRRPPFVLRYIGFACLILLLAYTFFLPSSFHMIPQATYRQQTHRKQFHTPAKVQQVSVVPAGSSQQQDNQHNDEDAAPQREAPIPTNDTQKELPPGEHPIDHLIHEAETTFQRLLANESHSIEEAGRAYRDRRGRHPPPGFDIWYQFARDRNAVFVEGFWDQIYHDLNPFWAVPARQIQKDSKKFEITISVRNGEALVNSDWFWGRIWLDLIKSIEGLLPDLDMSINGMDEPRVVVPWEDMAKYVAEAARTRSMPTTDEVIDRFQRLETTEQDDGEPDTKWQTTGPYWDLVRRGCPTSSAARAASASAQTIFDGPPHHALVHARDHMYGGFVANSSLSKDLCHQPDLQSQQGILIEPQSIASTASLFPIFGGSKLSVNNDILLPAAMYLGDDERFTAGGETGGDWSDKTARAIWRGVATGGRNRASNWRGFHRHRFVAMNNGTQLWLAERDTATAPNFAPPDASYKLAAQADGRLGAWVDEWSDCAFVDMMCAVPVADNGGSGGGGGDGGSGCPYTDTHFSVVDSVPLKEQFSRKYLPDIDGNSFSGRYLALLRSTSLPIKATVWKEWHDARLVAWKHFVPMDNRFVDWFGIMEYFLGYGEATPGHDAAAAKIAAEGKEWAEKVLRWEDMQIYVLRLLLEYARVADENRELCIHSLPFGRARASHHPIVQFAGYVIG